MDFPLESDRVDDLNFLSIVSRAPVIGTILWILGANKSANSSNDSAVDGALPPPPTESSSSMKRTFSKRSALKKTPPSLAGSEVSELADVGDSLQGLNISSKLGSRKKELSWSDESGKDLVEVIQESTSSIREAPSSSSAEQQPQASARPTMAMPRSRSVRNGKLEEAVWAEVKHHQQNLFDRQFGQTEPFPGAPETESPQWGWYINTTPPTPEMYYASRPHKARRENSDQTALTARSCDSHSSGISSSQSPAIAMPKYHPNPVFREMQDKNKASPTIDWPTVPL